MDVPDELMPVLGDSFQPDQGYCTAFEVGIISNVRAYCSPRPISSQKGISIVRPTPHSHSHDPLLKFHTCSPVSAENTVQPFITILVLHSTFPSIAATLNNDKTGE